jgi:hypothetical protein
MPPTSRERQTRKPQALFFVNKGVESGELTRSGSSTEAFNIHSFVQSRRRRRESFNHRLPVEDSSGHNPDSSDAPELESTSGPYRSAELQAVLQNFIQRGRTRSTLSSIHPRNNPLDPFNASVVLINSKTLQFLQYAFSSFSRRTYMVEALPPPQGRVSNLTFRNDDFVRERLQRCVEDTMTMDSTLAVGLTCAGWTTEQPNFEKPLDIFLGRAIRAVRTGLASFNTSSSPSSDSQWLLLSIYSLSISTFWLALTKIRDSDDLRRALIHNQIVQYLNAAVLHMKVAKTLMAEAGGPTNLHPYILSSLILGDKYLAITRMQPPILPVDRDPGRTPPAGNIASSHVHPPLRDLGASLIHLIRERAIPSGSPLLSLITDAVEYLHVSRSIWHSTHPDDRMEQWLFLRAQALCYRLLSPQNLGPVEECVQLTTLIFLISLAKYQGMAMSVRLLVPRLIELIGPLQVSQLHQDDNLSELLFWAVCIAGVALVAGENTKRDERLYSHLQAQATLLGVVAGPFLEENCALLMKYLFLPDEQESELRTFLQLES